MLAEGQSHHQQYPTMTTVVKKTSIIMITAEDLFKLKNLDTDFQAFKQSGANNGTKSNAPPNSSQPLSHLQMESFRSYYAREGAIKNALEALKSSTNPLIKSPKFGEVEEKKQKNGTDFVVYHGKLEFSNRAEANEALAALNKMEIKSVTQKNKDGSPAPKSIQGNSEKGFFIVLTTEQLEKLSSNTKNPNMNQNKGIAQTRP